MTAPEWTTDELMVSWISHQVEEGDIIAQGLATPLVSAAFILAKLTHAPNLLFAEAAGGVLTRDWAPLSLTRQEEASLRNPLHAFSFDEATGILLPAFQPKEFLRPAQVDPQGNTNNVAFGDYRTPRLRLPGCGGIADVTVYSPNLYLYVPRHSRAVFAERLDFVSGVGVRDASEREGLGIVGTGPRYLISDLGVFDFEEGRMRLVSRHPEVAVDRIRRRTGFPILVSQDLEETPQPTDHEIRLLRREIDPKGLRRLELLTGPRRRTLLREISAQEEAEWAEEGRDGRRRG